MALYGKLKQGLAKSRNAFITRVDALISGHKKIDAEFYEELEEILIQADVGVEVALELVELVQQTMEEQKISDPVQLKPVLKEIIYNILSGEERTSSLNLQAKPSVIVFVGVNGVGKTTSIGRLAQLLVSENKKVMLAAADTFRAAAIEQLEIWAKRVGVEILKHNTGSDPAAVVFDAVKAASARKHDVLLVDTAGRLHTKSNLMEELKKIFRVIQRELPDAPQEVLLVLDATTGNNAVNQAKMFAEAAPVTGIVLTKLDGTAKGGIVIAIQKKHHIPVKLVGIGESVDDLAYFDPLEFVEGLFD